MSGTGCNAWPASPRALSSRLSSATVGIAPRQRGHLLLLDGVGNAVYVLARGMVARQPRSAVRGSTAQSNVAQIVKCCKLWIRSRRWRRLSSAASYGFAPKTAGTPASTLRSARPAYPH